MPDLILWNSIASRRRSPSDDFLDNGLALLKAFVQARDFEVELADWARSSRWQKLTPRPLAASNRFLASLLIPGENTGKSGKKLFRRLAGPLFLLSQEVTTSIQRRRLDRMLRDLALRVRDSGCRVLGIKSWYGEAYRSAKELARRVRRFAPDVLIVIGGPHASIYQEAVLEEGLFDVVVIGEGEIALAGILELSREYRGREVLLAAVSAEAGRGKLRNLICRSERPVAKPLIEEGEAGSKAVSGYEDFEGKTRIHVIVDSQGCPWGKCNFCTHTCIYGVHSLRDPESLLDELARMISAGIGIFRFAGSSTTLNQAGRIAALIEARALKLTFSMFVRAEAEARREEVHQRIVATYRQLLRSGLRAVFMGAESGMDTVNELVMNKGAGRANIIGTVKAMRQAARPEGLPLDIGLSLIYPAPTLGRVTLEELLAENISLVEQTQPDSVLVSPPAPFPGTAWFNEKERFGFELGENFVREMLEYDYVLYKPTYLWPEIELKLEGRGLREILGLCQELRRALEDRGFVTEVTDEHFLMLRAAGYAGKEGAKKFKYQALLDLLSCDYRWINQLQQRVNQASLQLAAANRK